METVSHVERALGLGRLLLGAVANQSGALGQAKVKDHKSTESYLINRETVVLNSHQRCWSRRPSPGRPIGGLLQTKGKAMAAFDWRVLEGGGTAGSGCCHGSPSRTCVRWALGASWSCSPCTLLYGDRRGQLGVVGGLVPILVPGVRCQLSPSPSPTIMSYWE
ncbi:hypothetical protein EYF80_051005 [Liparis tanakae]|uniref:Uncharacterized protein n=1 Tax=Liparis tanakae TaxID=230148 RepID=A0A4Z2FCY2_9TELE|nr:hypothetical protein EYF80_051005 [Liparis tanakae]